MAKSNKIFDKSEVEARFTGETKYSGLTIVQDFAADENSLLNSLSADVLEELDMISIIANKQILGKVAWSSFGNTSGVAAPPPPSIPQNIILSGSFFDSPVAWYQDRVDFEVSSAGITYLSTLGTPAVFMFKTSAPNTLYVASEGNMIEGANLFDISGGAKQIALTSFSYAIDGPKVYPGPDFDGAQIGFAIGYVAPNGDFVSFESSNAVHTK
jgi:hypothetical protein